MDIGYRCNHCIRRDIPRASNWGKNKLSVTQNIVWATEIEKNKFADPTDMLGDRIRKRKHLQIQKRFSMLGLAVPVNIPQNQKIDCRDTIGTNISAKHYFARVIA